MKLEDINTTHIKLRQKDLSEVPTEDKESQRSVGNVSISIEEFDRLRNIEADFDDLIERDRFALFQKLNDEEVVMRETEKEFYEKLSDMKKNKGNYLIKTERPIRYGSTGESYEYFGKNEIVKLLITYIHRNKYGSDWDEKVTITESQFKSFWEIIPKSVKTKNTKRTKTKSKKKEVKKVEKENGFVQFVTNIFK